MDEETFPMEKFLKKNIRGGPPNHRTCAKFKKYFQKYQFAGLLAFYHMKRYDSESLDIYITPCKKAKRSEIYFSCYRRLKSAYFCRFRGRDKLSRKLVFLTIFYSFFYSQLQTFITRRVYKQVGERG